MFNILSRVTENLNYYLCFFCSNDLKIRVEISSSIKFIAMEAEDVQMNKLTEPNYANYSILRVKL